MVCFNVKNIPSDSGNPHCIEIITNFKAYYCNWYCNCLNEMLSAYHIIHNNYVHSNLRISILTAIQKTKQ